MSASCGNQSPVYQAIISIQGGLNKSAALTALNYAEQELEPLKNELKEEVSMIAFLIVILLVIIVILPLIAYVIWISHELNLSPWYIVVMIIFILVIAAFLIALAIGKTKNSLENTIDNALKRLRAYTDQNALNNALSRLNTAACVYNAARV